MNDGKINGDAPREVSPSDLMGAEMLLVVRQIEQRFAGAAVTLIVSAPGAAKGSPQFSYASTGHPDDIAAVMRSWMLEKGK